MMKMIDECWQLWTYVRKLTCSTCSRHTCTRLHAFPADIHNLYKTTHIIIHPSCHMQQQQQQSGASILRGVGRAISHIFISGGLTDWSFVLHIFDRLLLVVALGIPLMPIVNRDYLKLLLCLCKQQIAQYCGDSDNRIRVSEPHTAKE